MAQNILFIGGSLNQTTQMHQIAQHLSSHNCFFTPFYLEGIADQLLRTGLFKFSVLGWRHHLDTVQYLKNNHLPTDPGGNGRDYDLVVTCTDLVVQANVRQKRLLLVQEGITEPEGKLYRLWKALPFLPRYIANTATVGLSNAYDLFCVASEGYRNLFIRKGVRPEKMAVTGIPNFDNLKSYYDNDFPHREYVLVATTPYRETLRGDRRRAFLERCVQIANGRPLIFKLHPLENAARASREIRRAAPDALIFTHGNVNPMIANAATVITQQSTCTFVALALGKETFTYLDQEELRRLMPIQNGGTSAQNIALACGRLLQIPMPVLMQRRRYAVSPVQWGRADVS
ncbi:MAG: hypothetical protein ACOYYS_14340 [Chloroflexota bacterium]